MKNQQDLFDILENADEETLGKLSEQYPLDDETAERIFHMTEQKFENFNREFADSETYQVKTVKAYGWYKAVLATAACLAICAAGIGGIANMKRKDMTAALEDTQTETTVISTEKQTETSAEKTRQQSPAVENIKPVTEIREETSAPETSIIMTDVIAVPETEITTEKSTQKITETSMMTTAVTTVTTTVKPETMPEVIIPETSQTHPQKTEISQEVVTNPPETTVLTIQETSTETTTSFTDTSVTTAVIEETEETTETTAMRRRTAQPGFYTLHHADTCAAADYDFFYGIYLKSDGSGYLIDYFDDDVTFINWDSFTISNLSQTHLYQFDGTMLNLGEYVVYERIGDEIPQEFEEWKERIQKKEEKTEPAPELPEIPGFECSYDSYVNSFRETIYTIYVNPFFAEDAPETIQQNYHLSQTYDNAEEHIYHYSDAETRVYYDTDDVRITLKQFSRGTPSYPHGYSYGFFETSPIPFNANFGYFLSVITDGQKGESNTLIWTDGNYIFELYGVGRTPAYHPTDEQLLQMAASLETISNDKLLPFPEDSDYY